MVCGLGGSTWECVYEGVVLCGCVLLLFSLLFCVCGICVRGIVSKAILAKQKEPKGIRNNIANREDVCVLPNVY